MKNQSSSFQKQFKSIRSGSENKIRHPDSQQFNIEFSNTDKISDDGKEKQSGSRNIKDDKQLGFRSSIATTQAESSVI